MPRETRNGGYPDADAGKSRETRNGGGAEREQRPRQASPDGNRPRKRSPERRKRSPERGGAASHVHQMHSRDHEVDLQSMLIEQFRKTIIQRGGSQGIHAIGRIFRIMDDDGNRKLTVPELQTGLKDYGLIYDDKSLGLLMSAIDRQNTGSVSFDRFIVTMRGPVNKRRRALIDIAFKVLDKSGDGIVTMKDITGTYDAKHHPDVASGRLPEDQALNNFLAQFDSIDKDGKVTREEFQDYYKNVSSSIDDDDYFELMLRNAWHIPGGKGWCENTANTRVLCTFANGTQQVVMIEDDLGLDLKDSSAIMYKLRKQGIKNVVRVSKSGKV